MIEKILALLAAKFAGVRKDGLALLAKQLDMQVTTEVEAQALVEKLTVEKVTDFVKDWRAEVDKEVSTGVKTFEKTTKEKFDLVEKKPGVNPSNPSNPTNPINPEPGKEKDLATQIAEAISAAVKPLQEQVAAINSGKINESRRTILMGKLANVPENFKAKVLKDFGRMNFQKDEEFDAYLTETDTDITALNQELADKGLGQQSRPAFGQMNKDGISKATQEYLKSKENKNDPLAGKELKTH